MSKRDFCLDQMHPSLSEFKAHIRITSNDMDGDLLAKLFAATTAAEQMIGQTIALSRFTLAAPFSTRIDLDRTPAVRVVSVKVDGVTVDGSLYNLDGNAVVFDESMEGEQAVIVYEAGWEDVPYDVRAAILMHAAALFNNPVDSVEGLPKASTNLLRPYRNWEIGR